MNKKTFFGLYYIIVLVIVGIIMIILYYSGLREREVFADWTSGDYFKIETINGRKIFVDPLGKPFYSKGMIYAYGPDRGHLKGNTDIDKVLHEFTLMKEHGFNTLNLYGALFLDEMLSWCDKNKMAVYFRTDYTHIPNLSKGFIEFPDFMDPEFRETAKHSYDAFLNTIKNYHSVLAIDMDQRWLFDVDWDYCARRLGTPRLGRKTIKYLPLWLRDKYKDIDRLNKAWGREYRTFDDVLNDKDVIVNSYVRDLNHCPWRVDIVEYTLWTINDFLKELTGYMRTIDSNHLITYTTDLPEVIPFPISTKENSGIDFISPVHFNSAVDFYRDWIANGEMLYMTKWLNDLYQMPVYINETGFRTSPLEQNPPKMDYAAAIEGNEVHAAELYLRELALIGGYPWLLGWSYFKWYDKLAEGDFGYLRDDRSLKPVSRLGRFINHNLPLNMAKEKTPRVWIYYPEYALASANSSYRQYKSLVLMLEDDFLTEYEKMVKEALKYVTTPDKAIVKTGLLTQLSKTFNDKWLPFAFTSNIPDDDKPIILTGRALEQLSQRDRDILSQKRTVTIGPIGLNDERYNDIDDWYLQVMGISPLVFTKNDAVENAQVTVFMDGIECSGLTAWMMSIHKEEIGDCNILANFSDGNPAIIRSKDGKHVAFLYDPLTWAGQDKEISREVSGQAKILKRILF